MFRVLLCCFSQERYRTIFGRYDVMLQDLQVRHFEYETTRSFEDVISAFERAVGTVEGIGWESMRNASKSVGELESKVKERIGSGPLKAPNRYTSTWTMCYVARHEVCPFERS